MCFFAKNEARASNVFELGCNELRCKHILYPIMNFYQYNSYEEKTSPKIINSKIFPTANLGPNVSYIFVMKIIDRIKNAKTFDLKCTSLVYFH